jgi:hypothetical protein
MTTIRTAVLTLLLGAGSLGSAFAADAGHAAAAPVQKVSSPAAVVHGDAELRAEMDERLDPRAVAVIALGIGMAGLVAGARRRKALEALPGSV